MTAATKIEWADSTFNPWIGCTKISPACDHCYAEAQMDTRMGRVEWGAGKARLRTSAAYWKQPLRWNANAADFRQCDGCGFRGEAGDWLRVDPFGCPACGVIAWTPARRRVFCASLADVFDNEVDPAWRSELFGLIDRTPELDWLLLTKRIGNAREMMGDAAAGRGLVRIPENIWLGITICNQPEADRDIPKLRAVPAAVRFLSIEPMLGPVDLFTSSTIGLQANNADPRGAGDLWLDWVICGGESGPRARPMHPDWPRSLRDQCTAAGVPFMFKQWGTWGQYVNEDHFTYGGEEKRPHAWVDKKTGDNGNCWIVDEDGLWSNWTGDPPMGIDSPSIAVLGWYGKHAAGRLLDGVEHNGVPA